MTDLDAFAERFGLEARECPDCDGRGGVGREGCRRCAVTNANGMSQGTGTLPWDLDSLVDAWVNHAVTSVLSVVGKEPRDLRDALLRREGEG